LLNAISNERIQGDYIKWRFSGLLLLPDGSVGSDEMTRLRWLEEEVKGSEIDEGTTASTWLH
jgi:hypothetical protein